MLFSSILLWVSAVAAAKTYERVEHIFDWSMEHLDRAEAGLKPFLSSCIPQWNLEHERTVLGQAKHGFEMVVHDLKQAYPGRPGIWCPVLPPLPGKCDTARLGDLFKELKEAQAKVNVAWRELHLGKASTEDYNNFIVLLQILQCKIGRIQTCFADYGDICPTKSPSPKPNPPTPTNSNKPLTQANSNKPLHSSKNAFKKLAAMNEEGAGTSDLPTSKEYHAELRLRIVAFEKILLESRALDYVMLEVLKDLEGKTDAKLLEEARRLIGMKKDFDRKIRIAVNDALKAPNVPAISAFNKALFGHTENTNALIVVLEQIAATLPPNDKESFEVALQLYMEVETRLQKSAASLVAYYREDYRDDIESVNYKLTPSTQVPPKPVTSGDEITGAEATIDLNKQRELFDLILGYLDKDDMLLEELQALVDQEESLPNIPETAFNVLRSALDSHYQADQDVRASLRLKGRLSVKELENLRADIANQAEARTDLNSAIENLMDYLGGADKIRINNLRVKLAYEDTVIREAFDNLQNVIGQLSTVRQVYPLLLDSYKSA